MILQSVDGGSYDNTGFDDAVMNRGWLNLLAHS
jgi:hypothetical protein